MWSILVFLALTPTFDLFTQIQGRAITGITNQPAGVRGSGYSSYPRVSDNGQWVVFASLSSNLVVPDTNNRLDIFVWEKDSNQFFRMSDSPAGVQGNNLSFGGDVAADGSVTFMSNANNLGPPDTNGARDIFYKDFSTGAVELISVDSNGVQHNGAVFDPQISADGTRIVYWSSATNLISNDTNGVADIFMYDRTTGTTTRVSLTSTGGETNGQSSQPLISGDGRWIAYWSFADNIVPNDTNMNTDTFLYDTVNGTTIRVSVSSAGVEGDSATLPRGISEDGDWIVMSSYATNLTPGINNGLMNVFSHQVSTGLTQRVNLSSTGVEPNQDCDAGGISTDGRYTVFESRATNLVPGITNTQSDVFLNDSVSNTTIRISVDAQQGEVIGTHEDTTISGDGRQVAFKSSGIAFTLFHTLSVDDIFLASAGELYTYGNGCACSSSTTPFIFANGSPTPSSTVVFSLRSGLPFGTAYFYLAPSQVNMPLGNGCTQLISPLLPNPLIYPLDANGDVDVPLYFDSATMPIALTIQAFIPDSLIGPGYCLSNAIQLTIP